MTNVPDIVLPGALLKLNSRPLFALQLSVGTFHAIGGAPGGERKIAVIDGGRFEGDRLRGEVLSGGSDWIALRSDDVSTLDVRLVLQTDDNAMIGMTYHGLRHGPADVMQRMATGESIEPESYYFRVTAAFETAAPRYEWMNKIIAVGTGHRLPGGPIYNFFELL